MIRIKNKDLTPFSPIVVLAFAAGILWAPPDGRAQTGKTPGDGKAPPAIAPTFREQQKRTMTCLRTVAVAWETYFNDFNTYCPSGKNQPELKWGNITPEELQALLEPRYIKALSIKDGWGNPLQFAVQCLPKGGAAYAIRSAGSDKAWDGEVYTPGTKTLKPERDIVFSSGQFDQWPEGLSP